MKIQEIVRLPDPRKDVQAGVREVIHDLAGQPHLFVRVRLNGWHFPERAPEPFMVIGKAVSRFVIIGQGGAVADGYFDVRPSASKVISFGYGNIISWDFDTKVDFKKITHLDRKHLAKNVVDPFS